MFIKKNNKKYHSVGGKYPLSHNSYIKKNWQRKTGTTSKTTTNKPTTIKPKTNKAKSWT